MEFVNLYLETHTVFSNYIEQEINQNIMVNVTDDKGIQQAKELFFLPNHAYGEPDYRNRNATESFNLDLKKIWLLIYTYCLKILKPGIVLKQTYNDCI